MPLCFADENKKYIVDSIKGRENSVKRLESLGLVAGSELTILSNLNGNFILKIGDTKIAIDRELVTKINVEEVSV